MHVLGWTAIFLLSAAVTSPVGSGWKQVKDKHFVVHYAGAEADGAAVLRAAEDYYEKIAARLGYRRLENFWLHEKRCDIYVYPNRDLFRKFQPQAPAWSGGFAHYEKRYIAGFLGSDDFTKTTLPHEIAHLILRDYVGGRADLPSWVEEGVALSQEELRHAHIEEMVWKSFQERTFIPISKLTEMRVQLAKHHDAVELYYAEAALLIDFMLQQSKKEEFVRFCRHLRDGFSVDQALRRSYGKQLNSTKDLEYEFIHDLSRQFR